jgi:hypothetical protein
MQRDKDIKIGVGGSILEPDKGLIVMETRQPLRHLTLTIRNVGSIAASHRLLFYAFQSRGNVLYKHLFVNT